MSNSKKINIRYIVNNVDEAIPFYEKLGFKVDMHPAPGFAALSNGNAQLFLNAPGAGGAGKAGGTPKPGGWNRFQLQVDNVEAIIEKLQKTSTAFRGELVEGKGGKQILVEDPSGNPVEIFEPF